MEFRFEEKDLVVKKLFGEKRYPFNTLTKVELGTNFRVYVGTKCVLNVRFIEILNSMPKLYSMAAEYNFIIEDKGWFDDAISIQDVHSYGAQAGEEIQSLLDGYVSAELGEGYELVINMDESPYHIILFFDIYRNGVKMCMDDKNEVDMYSDYVMDGSKEYHLSYFELVMPDYVDPVKQEYRITKRVDYICEIDEIKGQIHKMKECGSVPASKFGV